MNRFFISVSVVLALALLGVGCASKSKKDEIIESKIPLNDRVEVVSISRFTGPMPNYNAIHPPVFRNSQPIMGKNGNLVQNDIVPREHLEERVVYFFVSGKNPRFVKVNAHKQQKLDLDDTTLETLPLGGLKLENVIALVFPSEFPNQFLVGSNGRMTLNQLLKDKKRLWVVTNTRAIEIISPPPEPPKHK